MTDTPYFENILNIGDLYFGYDFLNFEGEPILFTCYDNQNQLFLCLCSDIRREQKWIISRTSVCELERLITNKSDIYAALTTQANVVVVLRHLDCSETNTIIPTCELDELDLPKRGIKLRCNQKDAIDYLEKLKEINCIATSEIVSHIEFSSTKMIIHYEMDVKKCYTISNQYQDMPSSKCENIDDGTYEKLITEKAKKLFDVFNLRPESSSCFAA